MFCWAGRVWIRSAIAGYGGTRIIIFNTVVPSYAKERRTRGQESIRHLRDIKSKRSTITKMVVSHR